MGSEAKWTPEPWRIVGKDCDDDHRRIVQTSHVTRDVREIPRVPADLDRIVACVNACRDLGPDPAARIAQLIAVEKAAREALMALNAEGGGSWAAIAKAQDVLIAALRPPGEGEGAKA